jgi:hypothetical protein
MRGCRQFEDALWEAAEEGRPSPELAAHVRQCAECRRALQETSAAMAELAGLRAVRAPDPRPALRARLTQPRRGRAMMALAIAAACVVAALVVRAGWPGRRPAPVPQVAVRDTVDRTAPVTPIAPQPGPPAVVTVVRGDQEPLQPKPPRAVQARRPASRVARAKARTNQRQRKGTDEPDTQLPQSDRPMMAIALDEPCLQTTILYPRRPEPAPLRFVTADPTYRAAPRPARFIAVQSETPGSPRPIL